MNIMQRLHKKRQC